MRDHVADTGAAEDETIEEPRGRDALGLSPIGSKAGLAYELARGPMQGRVVTLAARLTSMALTVTVCAVLVLAVWHGFRG
jgi:hypothetical protein